jgi:glycine/D-amino acid oxidase-like deaminating enzyme
MTAPVFVVLGAGMQGTCAAFDLLRAGAREVRILDASQGRAERAAARVRSLAGGKGTIPPPTPLRQGG